MSVAVSRQPGVEREVTPLELFFDLVYVFAIGQLSHHLFEHVDLRTGAETLILALAVFYAWVMTAWGANWLEPDRLPVRALLVLTAGAAFVDEPFAVERLVALAIAFVGTVALWWCYFERAEPIGVSAAADDAGAVGWWGNWTLTLIVLALIAVAVGDEMAIADPGDDAALGFTLLAFGGPALFLLAQAIFHGGVIRRVPRSRLLGIAALAILAVATAPLTLIAGIAASSAALVAIAIADTL